MKPDHQKRLRYPRLTSLLVGCIGFASVCAAPSPILAEELNLGPFTINDENPESGVPPPEEALKHPLEMGYLVMTLTDRAESAEARGEHVKAAHYYLAVAKAGPDRAVGFSKACEAFEAAGDRENAVRACRDALAREGVKQADFIRYVGLMLKRQSPLDPDELADVEAVIGSLGEKLGQTEQGARIVTDARCQLAVRMEDEARLSDCVNIVQKYPANNPQRFIFSSLLAIKQHRWHDLEKMIADAQKAGVPMELLRRTRESAGARKNALEKADTAGVRKAWWAWGSIALLLAFAFFALGQRRLRPKTA